jgi:hypothetical protein
MTIYTNDDLYQIILDRLRKDRKGSINAEEFESFLNTRSIDYFNQQMGVEGVSKKNQESLVPFLTTFEFLAVTTSSHALYSIDLTAAANSIASIDNVWWSSSNTTVVGMVEVDMLTNPEINKRLGNTITAPSATSPAGYIDTDNLWVFGVTGGYLVLNYYKTPASAYFDYYADAVGNITYLTEGQSAYTLQTGEVARDGSVATESVTSASIDLEWNDIDAMNILDMVMTDIGVAQSDQNVTQASVLERQNNVRV